MNLNIATLTLSQSDQFQQDRSTFLKCLENSAQLPFGRGDTTSGMEYELQVAVEGSKEDVDLPLTIHQSSFYHNIEKRVARGELTSNSVTAIQDFISNNPNDVWENSWVRFEESRLHPLAREIFHRDLLADKRQPLGPQREDASNFFVVYNRREYVRVPISYLLKLALADILGHCQDMDEGLKETGREVLKYFTSDNTSPEILSLSISSSKYGRIGILAAQENCRTFLLIQLLAQYANIQFGLLESGQKSLIYNAPHAPSRQKELNTIIPDSFYRQLFLSPCLSGWDRGKEKHNYMSLCHKTLSRSQLNTISKLKDAGIITNNLIVLPNTSNTCLANNGTHVSLGSCLLTQLGQDPSSGFTPHVEKYYGDLVIKIVEHFLPLLVSTCSAAPYRFDFTDFHPEKMLGFLPHELDYTHLRMIWRRWKKKADIRLFGRAITPFGPHRLDRLMAQCFRLHGDLVPDFRLIDYMVTLLSTESSPALNGEMENQERLKKELSEMGVFDSRMSIYLPYRMRPYSQMGYSGFEGRSYSLFPSLISDMSAAVDLQNLITALAYRYVTQNKVTHSDIPDTPFVESERRQLFFGAAIHLPTVYIRKNSPNRFLRYVLSTIKSQRTSRRYKNYIPIQLRHYRMALLEVLTKDGSDLIEQLELEQEIFTLRKRVTDMSGSAASRLIRNTRAHFGEKRRVERIPANVFNGQTESYYRTELRMEHLREGLWVVQTGCKKTPIKEMLMEETMGGLKSDLTLQQYLESMSPAIINETAQPEQLRNIVKICLAQIRHEKTKKI